MRIGLNIAVFLLASVYCFAQKPMIYLVVEPKSAEIGEILTITVKTNLEGTINIDYPHGFVQGYNVMTGMEQETDYTSGRMVTYQYISQTGVFNKEGTYTIGPAFIKKGNKVYRSNTASIRIESNGASEELENLSSKQLRQPAFGEIKKSKSKVYAGEPVVLSARIYSHFSPTHLEGYESYSTKKPVEKYEIGNKQNITVQKQQFKHTELFTFEYDKQVVFPAGSGKIILEPFKVILKSGFESFTLNSTPNSIEVMPLPANTPRDFTDGVGVFKLTRELNKREFVQGDVMVMTLKVSGSGNLQNVGAPLFTLPKGLIIYGDPVITPELIYGNNGTEGKITFRYNIQLTEEGTVVFPKISMSYFDPSKEQYQHVFVESEQLNVTPNSNFNTPKEINDRSIAETYTPTNLVEIHPLVEAKKTSFLIDSPLFWISLISPLAFVLFMGIRKKQLNLHKDEVQEKKLQRAAKESSIQEFELAKEHLMDGNSDQFYSSLQKGLIQRCTAHLGLHEKMVLSKYELFQRLKSKDIAPHTIMVLDELFSECEHARFSMDKNTSQMEKTWGKAQLITQQIENQLN
jgi:hypothetical protein